MKTDGVTRSMLEHDRTLKQAIYNTGANVLVVLAGFGMVALYWVLESFFRPLMWAILCGAFLHPFKYKVTKSIKSWLSGLKTSGTPFALGIFKIPVDILDISSENLIQSLKRRWRVIAVVTGGFMALYITYHQAQMNFKQITEIIWMTFGMISSFINFFSFKWVCGLVICYLITVVKLWSQSNKQLLGYLSIPVWVLTMFSIIANAGTFRLPLAAAIIVLMIVGYSDARKNGRHQNSREHDNKSVQSDEVHSTEADDSAMLPEVSLVEQLGNFSQMIFSHIETVSVSPEMPSVVANDEEEPSREPTEETERLQFDLSSAAPEDDTTDVSFTDQYASGSHMPTLGDTSSARTNHPSGRDSARVIDVSLSKSRENRNSTPLKHKSDANVSPDGVHNPTNNDKMKMRRRSDKCFIFLFWAIALVMLWSNVWLVLLPMISFAFRLLKKLVEWIQQFVTTSYQEGYAVKLQPARTWCEQRLEVIVPVPVRGMINILLKGDKRVIDILLGSADTIITIMLILLLLVCFVLVSVGVCFQVQKEGIHLVTVTSSLVRNNTIQPQWLTDILRNGTVNETNGIHSSLDPMIQNLYTFGREWIVRKLSEGVSHEPSRELVQNELVGIWDSLYDSWVTKNTTRIAKPNYNGALFSQLREGGVDYVWQMSTVDISGIFNFVRENMGIFQSVVESVWILLRGNVNLAFTLLISLLQIILGGSTAILNSFVSLIVFFTTLFYLLASSCDDYKPVEWVTKLTISKTGSKFAQAVEDGIGGVFAATLKMAAFYGIYTWLTHTVFGINIVFLPSVFAAVLGAIPFVGTYWAALPAVLELSLIHKEIFLAILLAVFHVLPIFVVDTALYSDIKGGGHPYLTGLAIAGGIYCLGLQGAIVGPVLLCCIIVTMNLYSAMINPDHPITPTTPGSQPSLSRIGELRPSLVRSASTML